MSKIQNALNKCVDEVAALLGAMRGPNTTASVADLEKAFLNFYQQSWLLPELNDAQNAAIVTVSCIPLWELLNLYSGFFSPLAASAKTVAIGLLTTLYPKPSDRRCLFQQPEVVGTDYTNSVPLSTPVPMRTELTQCASAGTEAFQRCVAAVSNPVAAQLSLSNDRAGITDQLTSFSNVVLPSCVFVAASATGPAAVEGKCIFHVGSCESKYSMPFTVFAQTVWNFLLLANKVGGSEEKELKKSLMVSPWATKTFTMKGHTVSYATLISPIVDASNICLLTSSASAPTTDNKPFLAGSILADILSEDNEKPDQEDEFDFAAPCPLKKLPLRSETVAHEMEEQVGSQLLSSISQEIDFLGTSATCRDCDQLTMLCRNLLFSPIRVRVSTHQHVDMRISTQLNFDRKRPRGDDDGPALLPVTLALSDTLGSENDSAPTLLERLCTQWSATPVTES